MVAGALVQPAWRHDPGVFSVEVALLRSRNGGLIPGMILVDWITKRISLHESFCVLPIVVVRTAQEGAHIEADIYKVGGDQFSVDHNAWGGVHSASPLRHVFVLVVTNLRILERAPATQQNAAAPYLFVSRQCVVEEVEQIVVQGEDFFHELHILHQPDDVISEKLNGRDGSNSAGIQG